MFSTSNEVRYNLSSGGKVQSSCKHLLPCSFPVISGLCLRSLWFCSRCVLELGWWVCLFVVFCILVRSYLWSSSFDSKRKWTGKQQSRKVQRCSVSSLFLPLHSWGPGTGQCLLKSWCINPDLVFLIYSGMGFLTNTVIRGKVCCQSFINIGTSCYLGPFLKSSHFNLRKRPLISSDLVASVSKWKNWGLW